VAPTSHNQGLPAARTRHLIIQVKNQVDFSLRLKKLDGPAEAIDGVLDRIM
jgi:hypothetical protein